MSGSLGAFRLWRNQHSAIADAQPRLRACIHIVTLLRRSETARIRQSLRPRTSDSGSKSGHSPASPDCIRARHLVPIRLILGNRDSCAPHVLDQRLPAGFFRLARSRVAAHGKLSSLRRAASDNRSGAPRLGQNNAGLIFIVEEDPHVVRALNELVFRSLSENAVS